MHLVTRRDRRGQPGRHGDGARPCPRGPGDGPARVSSTSLRDVLHAAHPVTASGRARARRRHRPRRRARPPGRRPAPARRDGAGHRPGPAPVRHEPSPRPRRGAVAHDTHESGASLSSVSVLRSAGWSVVPSSVRRTPSPRCGAALSGATSRVGAHEPQPTSGDRSGGAGAAGGRWPLTTLFTPNTWVRPTAGHGHRRRGCRPRSAECSPPRAPASPLVQLVGRRAGLGLALRPRPPLARPADARHGAGLQQPARRRPRDGPELRGTGADQPRDHPRHRPRDRPHRHRRRPPGRHAPLPRPRRTPAADGLPHLRLQLRGVPAPRVLHGRRGCLAGHAGPAGHRFDATLGHHCPRSYPGRRSQDDGVLRVCHASGAPSASPPWRPPSPSRPSSRTFRRATSSTDWAAPPTPRGSATASSA